MWSLGEVLTPSDLNPSLSAIPDHESVCLDERRETQGSERWWHWRGPRQCFAQLGCDFKCLPPCGIQICLVRDVCPGMTTYQRTNGKGRGYAHIESSVAASGILRTLPGHFRPSPDVGPEMRMGILHAVHILVICESEKLEPA